MINSLRDLSKIVNDVVNYVVKKSCLYTQDGAFSLYLMDIASVLGIEYEDLKQYIQFILAELNERPEILKIQVSDTESPFFTVLCDTRYCPLYDGPDMQTRESDSTLAINQPINVYRLAELGKAFVTTLIEVNPERAEKLLIDELGASCEELLQLGLNVSQVFHLETMDVSSFAAAEIEEKSDNEETDPSWAEGQLEKEKELENYVGPFVQELIKESEDNVTIKLEDIVSPLSVTTESPDAQEEISPELVQEARDKVVLNLLENDYQYCFLKSISDSHLDDYVATYKELALMFLPRTNERFVVQSSSNAIYNGRICSIAEPTVLKEDYAFNVVFADTDLNEKAEAESLNVVRFKDLVPYKANDLIVGRWRIHLIFPGDRFGKNNSVINNNECLIEFWDMFATIDSLRKRELRSGQFYNHASTPSSEAINDSKLALNSENWHRRKMTSLYARQGQFTGARYYLSQFMKGYEDFLDSQSCQLPRGLRLSADNRNDCTISSFEMCKILRWLQYRPVAESVVCAVKGEIDVPLELFHEQDDIASYLEKRLNLIYGVSNIYIGQFGMSKTSTNVLFALQTSLKENSIEPIIKMLLPECNIVVNISHS
ncbi:MAG: hypothetical protein IJZ42_01440 [Lachnospiraceae bacterium]|nr:hypothetical protein [Lachnospiraceae bacterium]